MARILRLVTASVAALALVGPGTAAAATPIHVHVRIEGPTRTFAQSDPVPLTGTFAGHPLSTPTALGAMLAAARDRHVAVGLQWFSCCGFFVNSIGGIAGDSTHFWAFKVGHTLSSVGAGAVPATKGMAVLFYYTTFDPDTGATEPTLGLDASGRSVAVGGSVTFSVTEWNDAGRHTAAAGAWLDVRGAATRVDASGREVVSFTRAGTYPVRAALPGTIRSRTVWIHVTGSAPS